MILSSFFEGHGAEWSKIFLYGQLDHAKMSRFEQKLDAANAAMLGHIQSGIAIRLFKSNQNKCTFLNGDSTALVSRLPIF